MFGCRKKNPNISRIRLEYLVETGLTGFTKCSASLYQLYWFKHILFLSRNRSGQSKVLYEVLSWSCVNNCYKTSVCKIYRNSSSFLDFKVKDITQKYAGNWVTQTRKLRIDEEWWKETLQPYCPVDLIRDRTEDYHIETQMQKKPLPTSVAEYKNNPL